MNDDRTMLPEMKHRQTGNRELLMISRKTKKKRKKQSDGGNKTDQLDMEDSFQLSYFKRMLCIARSFKLPLEITSEHLILELLTVGHL